MSVNKQIEQKILEASEICLAEIERRARKILATHPNLDEFLMGMGTVFFSTKDGQNISLYDRAYMKSLDDFINDWDHDLHITGEPMRFTATGPVTTKW
jgi:hypothetical protein